MEISEILAKFSDKTLISSLTFSEKMVGVSATIILGVGLTFLVLIGLLYFIKIFGHFMNGENKNAEKIVSIENTEKRNIAQEEFAVASIIGIILSEDKNSEFRVSNIKKID